jgi:hypothetical protein
MFTDGLENIKYLTLYAHSSGSILLNILFLVIIILLSFLLNIRKIRKLNAKDIFKLD